jgi:glutathione S-transferase
MVGWGNFGAVIDALEGAVSQADYVVGDSFTAADVYVGSQIGWDYGSVQLTNAQRSNGIGSASVRGQPLCALSSSMMRRFPRGNERPPDQLLVYLNR